jgi:hypothetical protein
MLGCDRCVAGGVVAIVLLVTSAGGRSGAQGPQENLADYLPPGPGKALVQSRCIVCHDLRPVIAKRKPRAGWSSVVTKMVNEGADLTPEEMDQVSDYFGQRLGAEAPPLTDLNTADRDALMKIPGIGPPLADRIVEHRSSKGPFVSRDEVKTILEMDDAAFDTIKWYLRPAPPVR